jgi:hypothetical protein
MLLGYRMNAERRRAYLIATLISIACHAKADSLAITNAEVSQYFYGTALSIEGHSISISAEGLAIGDHGGDSILNASNDATIYSWQIKYGSTVLEGSALCVLDIAGSDAILSCEHTP